MLISASSEQAVCHRYISLSGIKLYLLWIIAECPVLTLRFRVWRTISIRLYVDNLPQSSKSLCRRCSPLFLMLTDLWMPHSGHSKVIYSYIYMYTCLDYTVYVIHASWKYRIFLWHCFLNLIALTFTLKSWRWHCWCPDIDEQQWRRGYNH